jgi:hypothetical protein
MAENVFAERSPATTSEELALSPMDCDWRGGVVVAVTPKLVVAQALLDRS